MPEHFSGMRSDGIRRIAAGDSLVVWREAQHSTCAYPHVTQSCTDTTTCVLMAMKIL